MGITVAESQSQVNQPEGETPAETAQPEIAQPGTEKPSDDNTWREQYTGLQGVFKQTKAQADQLRQQLLEQIKANALLQAQIQGASKEELADLTVQHDNQVKLAQAAQLLLEREASQVTTMQALEPVIKRMALENIAKQYKVDMADLEDAQTPDAAIALAKHITKNGKSRGSFQERKESRTDTAGSPGTGVVGRKLTSSDYFQAGLKEEQAKRGY